MQQTPAERRAELNRNTISGFRKVFLGPGLFLTLLSVCVILWPFGLAPPLLTFAFWWWLLVAWPGLNLMFRPDQTRELLERIWIIGGHALAIVWDIVANWTRELYARGISPLIRIRNKPRAAPERQRPAATLHFAGVGQRFALPSLRRLGIYAALVLFGLAWHEFDKRAAVREREHKIRNEYAVADARAAERAREAAKDISAIGARTQERRDRIETVARRGRDEIRRATPPSEAAIDPGLVAAFRRGLDELCIARADGSLADSCT